MQRGEGAEFHRAIAARMCVGDERGEVLSLSAFFAPLRLCVKLACSVAPVPAGFFQQHKEPPIVGGAEPAQQTGPPACR